MNRFRANHSDCDIAVVGSGLGGLVTALMLAPQPVMLLTRAKLGEESSSAWAQGGIAVSLGKDDHVDLHIADTLTAGDGLCDAQAVATILADGAAAIATLESFGVNFDRDPDGCYQLGLEAAHSRRRVLHAGGDGSGAAIVRALVERVRKTPSITVLEGLEVRRILKTDGVLTGLLCSSAGERVVVPANRIVLATGGIGGLYDAATSPRGNYGQGIMLAARAGAELADMEFMQFHPTALHSDGWGTGSSLPLISEAVRGEGAVLVNERGERFLAEQHGAELAPRDVVARAISTELSEGRQVFLDATEALGESFYNRFPAITMLCRNAGIDPAHERIPVRPAAHYHMGGVATDLQGRTSVNGLWVVGESACTGLHGANRLASNSLLEAVVMGKRAAHDILARPASPLMPTPSTDLPHTSDIRQVRSIVSSGLGVMRDGNTLQHTISCLLSLTEQNGPTADPALVALSMAVFAYLREESRGAHSRTDYPLKTGEAGRHHMNITSVLNIARRLARTSIAHTA